MASFLLDEDAALKAHLQGLTVNDVNDATRPVPVYYREPQKEVREQSYPYITIELSAIQRDSQREQYGVINPAAMGYDIPGFTNNNDSTTIAQTLSATPVNLIYNVRAFSRNPLHDRQLQWKLLAADKLPFRFGYLEVGLEAGGTTRRLELLGLSVADYKDSQGLAVFRKVYTVSVSSEMLATRVAEVEKVLSVSTTMRGHSVAGEDVTSTHPTVVPNETFTITQQS